MLDSADRVLLFEVEDHDIVDPHDPRGADRPAIVWITPGGGVEPEESFEEAARRELWEEAGISADLLRQHHYEYEKVLHFKDVPFLLQHRYFVVRVATAEVQLDGLNPGEQASYRAHRWWTLAELQATTEELFPPELPEIVSQALSVF